MTSEPKPFARILRIVTRLNTGGPTRHLATLSRALDLYGYEQWLVHGREGPREGSMRKFVESQGIRPILVPEMAASSRLGPSDVLAVARVRHIIRHLQPDVVETHTTKAGIIGRIAARLEHVPVVLHVYHGHVLAGYYGATKTAIAKCAERALARVSDHLVAVSARVKEDLVGFRVADPGQISVVEPGLDLAPLVHCRADRGGLRRELGLAAGVPLVGFVGRLCPIKNPWLFLEAAAAIAAADPDVRFVVVGDGELGRQTREHASRLELTGRVIFTGWRDDLPRVYADLDVLISCSTNEGMPLAVIEAMAAECPVVATRVGGIPDLIDDGVTGLLVRPGEPGALTRAVTRLLTDRPFARTLASTACRRAQTRFTVAGIAGQMDALYTRLLQARVAGPRLGALTGEAEVRPSSAVSL